MGFGPHALLWKETAWHEFRFIVSVERMVSIKAPVPGCTVLGIGSGSTKSTARSTRPARCCWFLDDKNPSLIQHVGVGWEGADLLAQGKGDHQQGERCGGGVKHHWTSVVCDTLNRGLALPQLFLLCSLSPDWYAALWRAPRDNWKRIKTWRLLSVPRVTGGRCNVPAAESAFLWSNGPRISVWPSCPAQICSWAGQRGNCAGGVLFQTVTSS